MTISNDIRNAYAVSKVAEAGVTDPETVARISAEASKEFDSWYSNVRQINSGFGAKQEREKIINLLENSAEFEEEMEYETETVRGLYAGLKKAVQVIKKPRP